MKFVVSFLLMFAVSAHAEKEAGGGNAIVCFGDSTFVDIIKSREGWIPDDVIEHIVSIEALDLAMAKKDRGWEKNSITPVVIPILETESLSQYVYKIERRYSPHLPGISDILARGRALFPEFSIIQEPFGIVPVDDAGIIGLFDKRLCVLATVLAQRPPVIHMDTRLYYHPLHSRLSQAALRLHEYVWAYAKNTLHHETSWSSQQLVSKLMALEPNPSVAELSHWIYNLGFPVGEPYIYQTLRSHARSLVFEWASLRDAYRRSPRNLNAPETAALIREDFARANRVSEASLLYSLMRTNVPLEAQTKGLAYFEKWHQTFSTESFNWVTQDRPNIGIPDCTGERECIPIDEKALDYRLGP